MMRALMIAAAAVGSVMITGLPASANEQLLQMEKNPGAWVMQNSGRAAASAACGVTPQAQNTGTSSARTSTASP